MATKMFGAAIKRVEDPRLITGKGTYTDDIVLPGQTYAYVLRSPYARARIKSINTTKAAAASGVVAVYTGKDMQAAGVNSLPVGWLHAGIKIPPHPPIAVDRVNYVGDAVAVVVAQSPGAAKDAAALIEVDYDVLPAVVDAAKALEEGAPQIHDDVPGNVGFRWSIGDKAKTDAAFANAAHVVKHHLVNNRLIPNAIEPRAANARFDPATGEVTLWMTSQNPHVHRLLMAAFILGIPEQKLRVIAPEVGGGFGSKIHTYAEETIVTWCSMQLGLPV
ncbi:MAG: xanthine dehydrogenase family protein molybdopterin-binding subunit, partial [Chloroflexi bacterium]|nr:xanthine dehydrogenase family protein molybdopterin-binding subunit [Chloroflexota bacterium]